MLRFALQDERDQLVNGLVLVVVMSNPSNPSSPKGHRWRAQPDMPRHLLT